MASSVERTAAISQLAEIQVDFSVADGPALATLFEEFNRKASYTELWTPFKDENNQSLEQLLKLFIILHPLGSTKGFGSIRRVSSDEWSHACD